MDFEFRFKNFSVSKDIVEALRQHLTGLQKALMGFSRLESRGTIVVEKNSRREEYTASCTFWLPKHIVRVHAVGYSAGEAVVNVAKTAREEVLKIKDKLKGRKRSR